MMDQAVRITQHMMKHDLFSQWLGIEVLSTTIASCKLRMTVRAEMCNGFGITHGGITYSLADSALAFASNSHGRHALSIESGISHFKPVVTGDILEATVKELNLTYRTGVYEVVITNGSGQMVAIFKGTVYRKEQQWTTGLPM